MNTKEIIDKSESLIQWLDEQIGGLEIPLDERTRFSCACLDMALEHQKSIKFGVGPSQLVDNTFH